MIEHIERIHMELQVHLLAEFGALQHGEIEVLEVRSYDAIATYVAKRIGYRSERGSRIHKPVQGKRVLGKLNGTVGIRPNGVADTRDGAGGEYYVKGISTLQTDNRRNGPAAHERIPLEGQIVDRVDDEPVAGIEVGGAAAAKDVRAVLHNDSVIVARGLIDGVRPRIGRVELQTVGHAF